ncbi:MAG: hypothetical protein INQ03_04050 [Candidatus Heimdallarchaeota archaeon]|nr:hypothetical protein [Candidatus Heimdallarchaeota archaeon]
MKKVYLVLLVFLLLASPASGRTRQKSIENFIDRVRLSPDGYANTPTSEVNITATTEVLEIASLLQYKINNSLDILLFYQNCQNETGGFASRPNRTETWSDTIMAVRGLRYLDLNVSQLAAWKIFDYLNSTAYEKLYTQITVNNITKTVPRNLTITIINTWYEFIYASFSLGYFPGINTINLIDELKLFQYPNGSYFSFTEAVTSIHLLTLLGGIPNDPDLSAKYILAHIQTNGAFAFEQEGKVSLEATYLGLRTLSELDRIWDIEYMNELIVFILTQQITNSGFKEKGASQETIHSTWFAIQSLFLLQQLSELLSPDVLQTEGFISAPYVFALPLLVYIRRRRES